MTAIAEVTPIRGEPCCTHNRFKYCSRGRRSSANFGNQKTFSVWLEKGGQRMTATPKLLPVTGCCAARITDSNIAVGVGEVRRTPDIKNVLVWLEGMAFKMRPLETFRNVQILKRGKTAINSILKRWRCIAISSILEGIV